MRDRLMERLVILPFSVGCISEASVAASVQQPRRSKADAKPRCKEEDDLESLSGESMKNSFGFMVAPKPPNTTTGIHKIVKGFKNISQLFVSKEDMEEMEREMEMEIGCPTDVKHVTHIGWDGCSSATATATATTSSPVNGWDNLITPDRLLSLPSPSLEHFRLSGPAHAHAHHPTTLLNAST